MKKIGIALFCFALCIAIACILPRLGGTWPTVDTSSCLEQCHGGENPYPSGQIHAVSSHTNCSSCHDGAPEAGNVNSSVCIVCHPTGDPGKCSLAGLHETFADCLTCHSDCDGGETTTTTTSTGPITDVTGDRYEVFLIGSPQACSATTMTFRSDNVLVLDCVDGFGIYLPLLNFFTALYWSNDFYLGYGGFFAISGFAFDPFITGAGIAYFGNEVRPMGFVGYLLTSD